ncbi:MAG: ABC transporter ATP-binding protein [Planctomycetota bacterium]
MSPMLKVEHLTFGYGAEHTLSDLSFEVTPGTFLAIAGPNGAGKTTLLNLLCGLLRPSAGAIEIDAENIEAYSVRKLAQKVAVVRQEFVPVFDFTVAEVVSMARTPYLGTLGFETKSDREIVAQALELTHTAQFASRPLAHLSGGERQRVFIARALAQNTAILLLDEPTSFLDLKHQVGIYDLLKKMQQEHRKTIVAVTHDINLAAQYCDDALLIGADGTYDYGPPELLFSAEQIKNIFGISTFVGRVGREKFFLPLGEFAKDKQIHPTDSNGTQQN